MSGVAILIALGVLIVAAVYTAILFYHWLRFGIIYPAVWIAAPIYVVGGLILTSIMFVAATAV